MPLLGELIRVLERGGVLVLQYASAQWYELQYASAQWSAPTHLGGLFLKPPLEKQNDNGEDLECLEIVVMNPDDEKD